MRSNDVGHQIRQRINSSHDADIIGLAEYAQQFSNEISCRCERRGGEENRWKALPCRRSVSPKQRRAQRRGQRRIAAACAEYPCGRTGNRQGRSSCRAEFALRCRTGPLPGSPATSISACRHRRNRFIARPNRASAVDVDGADVEEIAAAEIEERFLVEMEFGAFLAHPALGEHEQLGHVDPAVVLKIGLAVEPLQ